MHFPIPSFVAGNWNALELQQPTPYPPLTAMAANQSKEENRLFETTGTLPNNLDEYLPSPLAPTTTRVAKFRAVQKLAVIDQVIAGSIQCRLPMHGPT
jgi:hypothetical protein